MIKGKEKRNVILEKEWNRHPINWTECSTLPPPLTWSYGFSALMCISNWNSYILLRCTILMLINNKILVLQRVGRLGQIWGREEVFAQYPYPVLLTYTLDALPCPTPHAHWPHEMHTTLFTFTMIYTIMLTLHLYYAYHLQDQQTRGSMEDYTPLTPAVYLADLSWLPYWQDPQTCPQIVLTYGFAPPPLRVTTF